MKHFRFPADKPFFPIYVWACMAITLLLALVGVAQRNRVESHNRSICITAEGDLIASFAAADGVPMGQALNLLRSEGLRGVVISEEYVSDLISQGRLRIQFFPATAGNGQTATLGSPFLTVISGNPADLQRVERGISIRFKNAVTQVQGANLVVSGISPLVIRTVSLGIDPITASLARQNQLQIIARLSNPVGITPEGVQMEIAWAHDLGATVFLPQGDQVLGRRDGIKPMVDALRANQMLYANPEFAKMGGNAEVADLAPDITVCLHSALPAELDKDTPAAAVERYVKAARERNIRVLLLRQINEAGPAPLRDFGHFINTVAKRLIKEGDQLGPAHPFTAPTTPKFLYPLLGIVQVPIIFWIVSLFIPAAALPAAAITLLAALAAYSAKERDPMAFLMALAYPVLAIFAFDAYEKGNVVWKYLRTSLISLLGGLAVAALLSQLPYYVSAQEFQGVKAAVFLPIVFGLIYYSRKLANAQDKLKNPLTYIAVILGLVLLGVFAIMYMRTGNDNPAAVSPLELKLRNVLDRVLFVRPRTKSFLIGLPALWIAVMLIDRWRKATPEKQAAWGGWVVLAITVGLISQTDIVNTLCHIHTPVLLSLERIAVELVIGAVLGAIYWAIGVAIGRFWKAQS